MVKLFFVTDTGCRFITVDAYRGTRGFYESNGFIIAQISGEEENAESPTIPMFFDLIRVHAK